MSGFLAERSMLREQQYIYIVRGSRNVAHILVYIGTECGVYYYLLILISILLLYDFQVVNFRKKMVLDFVLKACG